MRIDQWLRLAWRKIRWRSCTAMNKDQSTFWVILASAALLAVMVETVVFLAAAQENRNEKNANRCIERQILQLQAMIEKGNDPAAGAGNNQTTAGTGGDGSAYDNGAMDQFLETSLTGIFSPAQLDAWSKSFWVYDIFINDQKVPVEAWKNGLVIEAGTVADSSGESVAKTDSRNTTNTTKTNSSATGASSNDGGVSGTDSRDTTSTFKADSSKEDVSKAGSSSDPGVFKMNSYGENVIRIAPGRLVQVHDIGLDFG